MFRRGQSCGGGYSSLGYLFGGDDPPRAVRPNNRGQQQRCQEQPVKEQNNSGGYGNNNSGGYGSNSSGGYGSNNSGGYGSNDSGGYGSKESSNSVISPENERPAAGKVYHDERYMDPSEGRTGITNNNYHRADGQNCGNFITDRPSTRVQSSPGGQSSLGYLFG